MNAIQIEEIFRQFSSVTDTNGAYLSGGVSVERVTRSKHAVNMPLYARQPLRAADGFDRVTRTTP